MKYWFEIDNVLRHLRRTGSTTGIQRVSLEIVHACAAIDHERFHPVRTLAVGSGFEIVDPRVLTGTPQPLESLRRMALTFRSHRMFREKSCANDWIIATGASWLSPRFLDSVRMEKARGLRFALFVHDIIPITHPHFVETYYSAFFTTWLKLALDLADCVLVASRHVESELAAYIVQHGLAQPRLARVRFGDGFTASPARRNQTEPFVLYVSSLDIRKNHDLLIRVWTRLVKKYGDKVPRLVFIGGKSYGSDDILAALEACACLNGRIEWRGNVSDMTMAQAYTDCVFTIYPSLCEGWGLPVAESLAYGRPCLVAKATSLPEVGEGFVDYFDPTDEDGTFALVEQALFETGWLAARETALKHYVPATWQDCARMIVDALGTSDPHVDGTPA